MVSDQTGQTADDDSDRIEQVAGDNSTQIGKARDVHIIQGMQSLSSDQIASLEQRYLLALCEYCCSLHTEGLDEGQVPLEKVFVRLQALRSERKTPLERRPDLVPEAGREENAGLPGRQGKAREPTEAQRPLAVPEPPPVPVALSAALKQAQHLTLLGEPGAGKSTILQFIALCFARLHGAQETLDLPEDRVPVRVALRELNPRTPSLLDSLAPAVRRLTQCSDPEARQLLREWWQKRRLCLLLDGLDEVAEDDRERVTDAIRGFVYTPEGAACRVIVSSRLAGYRDIGRPFREYVLCPFEGPMAAQGYVANWLAAIRSQPRDEQVEAEAGTLLQQMEKQGGLRRITGNPLLLRLAVSVYARTGQIAQSRAELYQDYVERVAWARARQRATPPVPQVVALRALERVAWVLQTRGEQSVSALAGCLQPEISGEVGAQAVLGYLHRAMGLLVTYGEARDPFVAFAHLTFLEYFAARHLRAAWERDPESTWAGLRPRLHHLTWREPLLLLASMLPDAGLLAERVLDAHSACERGLHRDLALCAALLGEAPESCGRVRTRVIEEYSHLLARQRRPYLWRVIGRAGRWLVPGSEPVLDALAGIGSSAAELLLTALQDRDWHVRVVAAKAMRELRALGAAQPLLTALQDENRRVRKAAARALGALRAPEAVQPLLAALQDGDLDVRWAAAEALKELRAPEALQPLLVALQGGDLWVRWAAAEALKELRAPEAVQPLLTALQDDDLWVRRTAAEALRAMRAAEAVQPLLAALQDDDLRVRRTAAQALSELRAPEAVPPLLAALQDGDWRVREAAAEVLGALRAPEVVPPLLAALQDGDMDVRAAAAQALGALRAPEALQPLLAAMKDREPIVRAAAAQALGELRAPEALQPLLAALQDGDWWVRKVAAEALGALRALEAVQPLLAALQDGNSDVREGAALALRELRAPEAVQPLLAALQDGDWWVRRTAAEALRELRVPEAVQPLLTALQDENSDVREGAARALGEVADVIASHDLASRLARALWRCLADARLVDAREEVIVLSYAALKRTVARLAVLEVAELPAWDPLAGAAPARHKPWLHYAAIVAALLALWLADLLTNLLTNLVVGQSGPALPAFKGLLALLALGSLALFLAGMFLQRRE